MSTTHYNLPTLQSTQGDIGDCLEDLLVEDSGNSGMEIIDETLYDHDQDINTLKGVVETFSVSSWTADNTIAPFTYKATVTLITTLSAQSIVELLNDDAVLFATYGFSIGDITNQVVTIYSIGEPSSTVSISIRIGGVLSNSGGGGTTLNKYTYNVSNSAASRSLLYKIVRDCKGKISGFNATGHMIYTFVYNSNTLYLYGITSEYGQMRFYSAQINSSGTLTNNCNLKINSTTVTSGDNFTSFTVEYWNDTEITA